MIFKQHLIDLILSGKKTQTRRPNRGYYVVGKIYALQPCRICKGIPGHRIEMDDIWEEDCSRGALCLSSGDAWEEGLYHRLDFELLFKVLYPKWDGKKRWAFKFHLVVVANEN